MKGWKEGSFVPSAFNRPMVEREEKTAWNWTVVQISLSSGWTKNRPIESPAGAGAGVNVLSRLPSGLSRRSWLAPAATTTFSVDCTTNSGLAATGLNVWSRLPSAFQSGETAPWDAIDAREFAANQNPASGEDLGLQDSCKTLATLDSRTERRIQAAVDHLGGLDAERFHRD